MSRWVRDDDAYHDRTVQDWHRHTFGPQDDAIDIDLMGICHECREALYLIEASTNPKKATTAVRRLGTRADVPSYLVLHKDQEVLGGQLLGTWNQFDTNELAEAFRQHREEHVCK